LDGDDFGIDCDLGEDDLHPAGFFEPYPSRAVNNIYFDTYDYFAYRENLSGASARSKVRYRWYGDTKEPDSGTLEVKRRRGGLGWKLSYRTGAVPILDSTWTELRHALRKAIPAAGTLWLDANPLAVLMNHYRRRYFETSDRRVRLTFDWNQRVFDQRASPGPAFDQRAHLPDTVVVELKFDPTDRRFASSLIQGLPLRLSRNSKYVIGCQAIQRG
ncbi:MAG: VTC domain-containing protein, partial [Proteobacteria bacterium]|nr:VTC domain-containing protein [Pseudomonadota bacterium]